MDNTATTSPRSDEPQHPAPPDIHEMWSLIQEQRRRIDSLEATSQPLPVASERAIIGRPPITARRRRQALNSRTSTVTAAEAFRDLAPVTAQYATVDIMDGFNWAECTARLEPGEWYMVVFRSTRREAADDLTLEMHDYGAYIEAERRAVGLLYYFRGTANEHRECLSFCIWSSRTEAVRAAQLPLHRIAMSMVDEKYESYTLERYIVRKTAEHVHVEVTPVTSDAQTAVTRTH
jgi:hypothetical protein